MNGFDSVDKLANSVKTFRGFDACDIWVSLCILMGLFIVACTVRLFKLRAEELKNQAGWREIRNNQIASETAQTEVLRQLTQESINARAELGTLKSLITDYLIGGKHV